MGFAEDEYKRQVVLKKLKNLESATSRMFAKKRIEGKRIL
jgi:hypothetical protein